MTADPIDQLVSLAATLPDQALERLIAATRGGPSTLATFRAGTGTGPVRAACAAVKTARTLRSDHELAGLLDGLRRSRKRDAPQIDMVWSGPSSGVTTHRLTSATVADLIDEAYAEVMLVSYAMHSEPSVAGALRRAAGRSVDITLLAERSVDNPKFSGGSSAFADIPARRLAWPAPCREPGAALHAKLLVVDGQTVLVGSANLTQAAMHRNLECGVLIRDRSVGRRVVAHLRGLEGSGVLAVVPESRR